MPTPGLHDIEGVQAAAHSYLESSLLEAPLQNRGPVLCASLCCASGQPAWGLNQGTGGGRVTSTAKLGLLLKPFGSGRGAWTGMNGRESSGTREVWQDGHYCSSGEGHRPRLWGMEG